MCMHIHMQQSLPLVVAQESTKLAGVDVIMEGDEEVLVELKRCWELDHDLPDTVQELCENWRGFPNLPCQVTTPTVIDTYGGC